MKRVVWVLELSDDEAEIVENAISGTKVRFAGLTLGELMEASRAATPSRPDGTDVSHAISEGALYLGNKPLRVSSLFSDDA